MTCGKTFKGDEEMKYVIAFLTVVLSFCLATAQDKPKDVVDKLLDSACTIRAGRAQGSGVIIKRGDTNFVWTAAHVIEDLRKAREVIDPKTGGKKFIITFDTVNVVTEFIHDGERVEERSLVADVVRYSNANDGEDLALLKIRKKNAFSDGAVFYLDDKPPRIGSRVINVGSPLGFFGHNTYVSGDLSALSRVYENKIYDQVSSSTFGGCSGSGVYLTDGRYIGMLVRGSGETFSLIVPMRRIQEWSKKINIEWALDPKIKLPPEDDLKKMPVEDVHGISLEKVGPTQKQLYPFLIKYLD